MIYYVYILISEKDCKRYIGLTTELERRIKEHNSGRTKSTKSRTPFRLEYFEKFDNIVEARSREKYFKSSAGRRYLVKIQKSKS